MDLNSSYNSSEQHYSHEQNNSQSCTPINYQRDTNQTPNTAQTQDYNLTTTPPNYHHQTMDTTHNTDDMNFHQKEYSNTLVVKAEAPYPQKVVPLQTTHSGVDHNALELQTINDPQKEVEKYESPPPFCRECLNLGGICQVDASGKLNKLGYLQLQVGGFHIRALVDTGASVSVMSQELLNQIWVCDPESILWRSNPKTNATITLADGQKVPILEKAQLQMQIFDEDVHETFHILKDTHTTILGWPFFANNDLTIDCKRRLLIRENCTFQINSIITDHDNDNENEKRTTLSLCLEQGITLPAGRQEFPYCKLENEPNHFQKAAKYQYVTGVVEPSHFQKGTKAMEKYAIGHTLVTLDKWKEDATSCSQTFRTKVVDSPKA